MEDASIKSKQEPEQAKEEPLYQSGRFPSVVDTDDLVFELGKQAVQILNHGKLLDNSIKQITSLKDAITQAVADKTESELKAASLSQSNKTYEQNNRELGDVITQLRKEAQELIVLHNQELADRDNTITELNTIIEGQKAKKKPIKSKK